MPVRFLEPSQRQAYLDWVEAHPDGYCIELRSSGLPPMLHRVGCCCLGLAEVDWVPIPVYCFTSSGDIRAWYDDNDLVGLSDEVVLSLQYCLICEP